jgi:hypothetical protein
MTNPVVLTDITSTSSRILSIRGKRVILDSDLADLYGVTTKRLNEQVRRNPERFPGDFAFLLTSTEWESLRSQIATLKKGRGHHRKFLPYAFTEHGALMAASVLNSSRAIETSIFVVRTFIAMREGLADSRELANRLDELEQRLEKRLEKHDQSIAEILAAIRGLMNPSGPPRRPIGFIGPA